MTTDDRRYDPFAVSPLIQAGADPYTTLAAAVLNQAIVDLRSTGRVRLGLEREAQSRGMNGLEHDVDTYLNGELFEATAWRLGVQPETLRKRVLEYARDHAGR